MRYVLSFILLLLIAGMLYVALSNTFRIPTSSTPFAQRINENTRLSTTSWASEKKDGECYVYTSLSNEADVIKTLSPNEYTSVTFTCSDGYTSFYQQYKHTCNSDRCVGKDGREYARGDEEKFYRVCGVPQQCSFPPSLIILGAYPDGTSINLSEAVALAYRNGKFVAEKLPSNPFQDPATIFHLDQVPQTLCDGTLDYIAYRIRPVGTTKQLNFNISSSQVVVSNIDDDVHPFVLHGFRNSEYLVSNINSNPDAGTCTPGSYFPEKYLWYNKVNDPIVFYTPQQIATLSNPAKTTFVVRLETYLDFISGV